MQPNVIRSSDEFLWFRVTIIVGLGSGVRVGLGSGFRVGLGLELGLGLGLGLF